jgi:hypothetical protein
MRAEFDLNVSKWPAGTKCMFYRTIRMLSAVTIKEFCVNKILSVLLLFLSACILMAQQNMSQGEFVLEIRQINQQQVAVIIGYKGTSTQIIIPDQINGYPVAGIGNDAFRSCRIESVKFPSTLVFIGEYAFYDNKLSSVSLPSTVTSVGTGAFDNNIISGNTPPRSSAATYVRTFTIEPAHSETVYAQKPNPVSGNVNIVVVPGYNPVGPLQSSVGIVTMQKNPPNTPSGVNRAPLPTNTSSTSTYSAPVRQQSYTQPQSMIQQVPPQNYQQQQRVSNTGGPMLIAETSVDKNAPSARYVPEEKVSLQIYAQSVYPVWQNPASR